MTKEIQSIHSLQQFIAFMEKYDLKPNSYIRGMPFIDLINFSRQCYGEALRYLLKEGANPNLKSHYMQYDAYESTTLHSILVNELIGRAKLFIKEVSNPQISQIPFDGCTQDVEGKTVLIMGALLRNTQIVHLCLFIWSKSHDKNTLPLWC
jgi:hypothetical protein